MIRKTGRASTRDWTYLERLGIRARGLEEIARAEEAVALVLQRGDGLGEGRHVLGRRHRAVCFDRVL